MSQQPKEKDVPIDQLLALMERAAGTIERLQLENAALNSKLRERADTVKAAEKALQSKEERIRELEEAAGTLREDAEWCRWFRGKYGDSAFFSHIERDYQLAHPKARDEDVSRLEGVIIDETSETKAQDTPVA